LIFTNVKDCDECFGVMHKKIVFAQDELVRDMGSNLVD
jgi:hypothetical protein